MIMHDDTFGQVGLCRTHGWLGRLVSRITGSPWTHSVVGLGDGYNVSAEPGGVAIHTDEYWPDLQWTNLPMTEVQKIKCVAFALSCEGVPYAWGDDTLIGISKILHIRLPKFLLRHIASERRLQCSELCDLSLRAAGVNVFPDDDPGVIYPGMYAHLLEK